MNFKNVFWGIGYALPLAAALLLLIPLRKEYATLQGRKAQTQAELANLQLQWESGEAQLGELKANLAALDSKMQAFRKSLSPEQKRWAAILAALAKIVAEANASGRKSPPSNYNTVAKPYFGQLLNNPDYAKAVSVLLKQKVEMEYGRMFARLNLSSADQDSLEDLLTQLEMAREDVTALMGRGSDIAARTQAKQGTVADIDDQITAELGPDLSTQYRAYAGRIQFYDAMDSVAARLNYTADPLQPDQEDQMVAMIRHAYGRNLYTSYWSMPASVVAQSSAILSPPQVAALQEVQEEQVARIQTQQGGVPRAVPKR